jgi:hypothetical protein
VNLQVMPVMPGAADNNGPATDDVTDVNFEEVK